MTILQAKTRIKAKFGTISAFSRATKWDRYELQKIFGRTEISKQDQERIKTLLATVQPLDEEIPKDKLELLKSKIQEFGGPYKFSTDNPQFVMRNVYEIYEGKRKRVSRVIQELFDHFKI